MSSQTRSVSSLGQLSEERRNSSQDWNYFECKRNSRMMFRCHVLNLQIYRIKKLLGLAYQHVLFAAKVCICYTEQQQESSVLATINLEKQKWKTFDESYSLFFLLLNVCTYVHDCDLTPIWCRRHLSTEKLK